MLQLNQMPHNGRHRSLAFVELGLGQVDGEASFQPGCNCILANAEYSDIPGVECHLFRICKCMYIGLQRTGFVTSKRAHYAGSRMVRCLNSSFVSLCVLPLCLNPACPAMLSKAAL
ncbi:unnamed protein product [Effrenium voratum]|uniref:Uncharacterized protein n=1 Tax=Effrenium voratum TaxID=2562239 RepID=A0AA36IA58_9DINO|nr:unnamed protein product [Effrenium voratum]CAJ1382489.1 unnamed protein product [Effrenium voratum]